MTMTDYAFKPGNLELKSGTATFYLVNSGGQQHDMVIAEPTARSLPEVSWSIPGTRPTSSSATCRPAHTAFTAMCPVTRRAGWSAN